MGLHQSYREGRVFSVAVQTNNSVASLISLQQCVSVSLSGRNLSARLVGRGWVDLSLREYWRISFRNLHVDVGVIAGDVLLQLSDDSFGIASESLSVPIQLVLDFLSETFSLEGLCQYDCGMLFGSPSLNECLNDGIVVMPVDFNSVPTKGLPSLLVGGDVVLEHRGLALPQSINIDYGNQIAQFVMAGKVGSLPYASLSDLTVSQHAKNSVVNLVQLLARVGHAGGHSQTLSEGARRNINKRNLGGGMPLNDRILQPERHELFVGEYLRAVECGVQQGSRMPLGKHEPVIEEVAGVIGMEMQSAFVEEQHSEDVSDAGAAGGMPGFGDVGCFYGVDAHEIGHVGESCEVLFLHFLGRLGLLLLKIFVLIGGFFCLAFGSLGHVERYPLNKLYMGSRVCSIYASSRALWGTHRSSEVGSVYLRKVRRVCSEDLWNCRTGSYSIDSSTSKPQHYNKHNRGMFELIGFSNRLHEWPLPHQYKQQRKPMGRDGQRVLRCSFYYHRLPAFQLTLDRAFITHSQPITLSIMKMLVLWFLTAAVLVSCQQNCQPFGVRTFFGSSYTNPQSQQLFSLRFNTNESCASSFLQVVQGSNAMNIDCSTLKVTVKNQTTFTTYVHSCNITDLQAGKPIQYDVIGVDDIGAWYPYRSQPVTITLVDPQLDQPNKFIVLADWSKLINKTYVPLKESFSKLLAENRSDIHGVVLIGDIGYDLESNECENYIGFLEMLSQVAECWPVLTITGNHQYISKNNWKLYAESFQTFQLTNATRRIQSYYFKWFNLMTFDPYELIYGIATKEQTEQYIADIESELKALQELRKPWAVSSSHYPLLCSCNTNNCTGVNATLLHLFSLFNDYHYNMYLGAHTHIYERQYPYYKGTIMHVEGPYHNIDSMVSVVEGVAGNEKSIVEEEYALKKYTAKATFNETGFGILTAWNQTHLQYQHISTKGGYHVADSVLMTQYQSARQLRLSRE